MASLHDSPVSSRSCVRCGAPLKRWSASTVCWRCIMAGATSANADHDSPATPQNGRDPPAAGSSPAVDPLPTERVRRFGDYLLEAEIAHGGMGVVFRARQISLDRTVAVKLLLLGRFSSEDSIERFRREAQSAAALRHPHIVAIHEVGEHEGQSFFSMEFVEGRNLADVVRAGPLPATRAAEYAQTIAEAIHYAHTQGVLHRDLKPSNVLIDERGEIRITDFGLAKRFGGSSGGRGRPSRSSLSLGLETKSSSSSSLVLENSGNDSRTRTKDEDERRGRGGDLTIAGQMLGTPNYLSPEAAAGRNDEVGPASDVYAIGALLYELLTGRPPFLAQSLQETLLRIRDTEPVAPRALNPGVPRDLETITLKCLEKPPARRYASAQDLADDLGRWLRHEPIRARPVTFPERGWKWAKRKPMSAALAGVTVLAVAAFIASQAIFNLRLEHANSVTQKANVQLSANVRDLEWQRAEDLEWEGKFSNALALFSRFLRENPDDQVAASRVLSLLSLRNFALPTSEPLTHDGKTVKAELSPDGRRVLTASTDGTARIWDATTSQQLVEARTGSAVIDAAFLGNGERFVTLQAGSCQLWEVVDASSAISASSSSSSSSLVLDPNEDGHQNSRTRTKDEDDSASSTRTVGQATSARLLVEIARAPESCDVLVVKRDRSGFAFDHGTSIRAYDAVSGKPLGPMLPLEGRVWIAEFSGDGRSLLTSAFDAAHDGYVSIWEIASGVQRLGPLRAKRPSVALAPDGSKIVVASTDGILSVVDATTGEELAKKASIGRDPMRLKVSPDGRRIVTALWEKAVRIWEFDTLEPVGPPLEGASDACIIDVSPDSRYLVTGSQNGQLQVWQLSTGAGAGEAFGHEGPIKSVCFAADNSSIATASEDGTARLWDTRMRVPSPQTLHVQADVRSLAFSPDGQRLISASSNGAQISDARTLEAIGKPMVHDAIFTAGISPDGRLLYTASHFGTARLWDAQTGDPVGVPLVHRADVWHCAFTADGRTFVSTSRDAHARVWDVATGELLFPPIAHPDQVDIVRISPDQERFVTGCGDAAARLWSLRTGMPMAEPMRHRGIIWAINFNSDGSRIVTASADTTARLWDGRTGAPVAPPMQHDRSVLTVTFSPDGRRVLTTSEDGTARVWDASTGEPVSRWMRHRRKIWAARFSPDGQLIATVSDDHSARLWDAQTGFPISEPLFHAAECQRISFSPDGTRLATGSTDGVICLWDVRRAPVPAPAWFIDLADAMAGRRLGARGEIERTPGATLRDLREEFSTTTATDFYSRWGRWFFSERTEEQPAAFVP